jgi:DNA-binding IclR family transcriptional regulator
VLAVLQAFSARRPVLTARELAELTAIPLPSMYRYIALLRDTGLLVGDERGAYHLSVRLIALARAAEAADGLIPVADAVMRDLVDECGETAIFVRLIARAPVCVHRVESPHHLRASFEPGEKLPLLGGASGRVLLAGLPERQRRELLAQADPEAAAGLEESVARVAARGWATSEEEIEGGIFAASAAVTDGRATVAALTVPSPLVRAPAALQERLLGQVRAAAARLSEQIENSKRS